MVPRWAVLAAAFLVAGAGVAMAAGNTKFLPDNQTTCWSCHEDFPQAPLPKGTFYNIVPPARQPVPPETASGPAPATSYTVRFQNEYTSDGIFTEATLSLANAPSIRFRALREPIDTHAEGTIDVDPTQLTSPQSGTVVMPVPSGATHATVTLTPADVSETGPDLALRIFSGPTATGEPGATQNTGARGKSETLELEGAALNVLGSGNWTIEARYTPLNVTDPTNPQPPTTATSVDFKVDLRLSFAVAGLLQQTLSTRDLVKPSGASLFTWTLEGVAGPVGAGEFANITINATLYHDHNEGGGDPPQPSGNYGNFTKTIQVPVVDEGMPTLKPAAGTIIDVGGQAIKKVSFVRISEALGYGAAFLMLSSIASGGMFGKASRRGLNTLFGAAKRRVAFHNSLSYGLTVLAAAHMTIFLIDNSYAITQGLLFGGLSILSMFGLGVTGALQIPMIRKWNYGVWRWSHYTMTVTALLFLAVHILLEGVNIPFLQEITGYHDPFDPNVQG